MIIEPKAITEVKWYPDSTPPPDGDVYLVIRRHVEPPHYRFIDIVVWKAIPAKYRPTRLYEQPSHWHASELALAPVTHWARLPEMPPDEAGHD